MAKFKLPVVPYKHMAKSRRRASAGRKSSQSKAAKPRKARGRVSAAAKARLDSKIKSLKQHLAKNEDDLQNRHLLSQAIGIRKMKYA